MPCCPRARSAAVLSRASPSQRPPASDPPDPARSHLCRRPVPPSTAQSTVKMPSHKSLRTKLFLAKKMKQNRPIPQWIRLRTDNRIRYVPHPRQPPPPRSPPQPRATAAAAMPKDGAAQPPPYGPGWRHHVGLCTRGRLSCTSRAMQPTVQRRRRRSRRRGGIRAVHTWVAAGCGGAPAAPPPTAADRGKRQRPLAGAVPTQPLQCRRPAAAAAAAALESTTSAALTRPHPPAPPRRPQQLQRQAPSLAPHQARHLSTDAARGHYKPECKPANCPYTTVVVLGFGVLGFGVCVCVCVSCVVVCSSVFSVLRVTAGRLSIEAVHGAGPRQIFKTHTTPNQRSGQITGTSVPQSASDE